MMNTTPALEKYINDIVSFVLSYRKADTKAFKGWSEEQLRNEFRFAAMNLCMCSVSDIAGNIVGVCNGRADEKNKLFYVNNILARPGYMKSFISMFHNLFPGYKLAGLRYGKQKQYDLTRFKKKFAKAL